jgi:hypothetical protein
MHIQALNGGHSWQPGDTVTMDNIVLSEEQLVVTPEAYYAFWLTEYPGTGSDTNLTDNPDFDAADNLQEYAFGGDPSDGLDTGHWPMHREMQDLGTNYVELIHYERSDAAARGLFYHVETVDDLVGGVWTNAGVLLIGEGPFDSAFNTVTNRIPILDDQGFIRLRTVWVP